MLDIRSAGDARCAGRGSNNSRNHAVICPPYSVHVRGCSSTEYRDQGWGDSGRCQNLKETRTLPPMKFCLGFGPWSHSLTTCGPRGFQPAGTQGCLSFTHLSMALRGLSTTDTGTGTSTADATRPESWSQRGPHLCRGPIRVHLSTYSVRYSPVSPYHLPTTYLVPTRCLH